MEKKQINATQPSKKLLDFISQIADVKPSSIPGDNDMCYYSKIDGSYLCHESNLEEKAKFLLKYGITEQIYDGYGEPRTCCIGFNPVEQKWYGWSHRAVFGFGVGSEVKEGHCAYVSKDINDHVRRSIEFWSCESHKNVSGIVSTNEEGVTGAQITWEYVEENVPNKDLHGTIGETFSYPPSEWGRGEWKAETLEDAKQMAIDFARGVS